MVVNDLDQFPKNIALVHEWFSSRSFGGAEQVVHGIDNLISSIGSKTNLFSLVESESHLPESWLYGRSIQTSVIQRLPFGRSHVQQYLPLLPYAIEQLDLTNYPLVISSSHLVAKGVLTSPDQLHVSYVHSPARYAWDQMNVYLQRSSLAKAGLGPLIRWQLHCLRQWDQLSAMRVNCFLANSSFTARRISKYWGRKSHILHPPVNVNRFSFKEKREDYYLCLCRLVPNKNVDLVVKTFNLLNLPLIIVGDGPERNYLETISGPSVKFLGFQSKKDVEKLMEKCRAYVYAGIEDFGIAPVEAMAAGAPVIALGKGGLLDTVKCALQGVASPTGILFSEQSVDSCVEAIQYFEKQNIYKELSPESINKWAQNFRPEEFSRRFKSVLRSAWKNHQISCAVKPSDLK